MNTDKINNAVARAIILYSSNYLSLSLVADFYSAIIREFRISNDEFKAIEKNVHDKLDKESSSAFVMPIWVFEDNPKNKAKQWAGYIHTMYKKNLLPLSLVDEFARVVASKYKISFAKMKEHLNYANKFIDLNHSDAVIEIAWK